MVLTDISQQLFVMKFSVGFHVIFRIHCKNFGAPLAFYLVSSSGQNGNLSKTLVYDHAPVKLMTFPSASAALFCAN